MFEPIVMHVLPSLKSQGYGVFATFINQRFIALQERVTAASQESMILTI
jgi:N-acetylmuramoyl-L-alanine amidase